MIEATLTERYLWKGQVYEPGDRQIPDDLAAALGLTGKKQKTGGKVKSEKTVTEAQSTPPSQSLTLINQASEPAELKPLPGIGEGAAKRLLLHRPEGGYASLEQVEELCPELTKSPYRVEWEAIAQWQPETETEDS